MSAHGHWKDATAPPAAPMDVKESEESAPSTIAVAEEDNESRSSTLENMSGSCFITQSLVSRVSGTMPKESSAAATATPHRAPEHSLKSTTAVVNHSRYGNISRPTSMLWSPFSPTSFGTSRTNLSIFRSPATRQSHGNRNAYVEQHCAWEPTRLTNRYNERFQYSDDIANAKKVNAMLFHQRSPPTTHA